MSEDVLSRPSPPFDLRIAYGSDGNQFIDLRLPSDSGQSHPVVINIHGGFWRAKYNLDHGGHLCAALTARGLATANLEYRRVGNDGGGWPATFSDIRSAHRFLLQNAEKYNFDRGKVALMGHSAGGQLALCLAAHEAHIRAVISLAGVLDLERAYQLHLSNDAVVEFLHGTPSEVPDHYREADPMQLSIGRARQWLLHGSQDQDVPPSFSRDYVSLKQKRPKREREDVHLVEIPGAGHLDLIDPRSSAWSVVEKTAFEALA